MNKIIEIIKTQIKPNIDGVLKCTIEKTPHVVMLRNTNIYKITKKTGKSFHAFLCPTHNEFITLPKISVYDEKMEIKR